MMKFNLQIVLLILISFLAVNTGRAQVKVENLVQINGVVMTSDSLYGVPDVVVTVKNQNKGAYTSPQGVFTLVCFKGDTLHFQSLGFRSKDYVIPLDIKGNTLSLVQLMSQDTFYLNETIIYALPSKETFNYVFQNLNLEDDRYELARKNASLASIRVLSMMSNRDGREAQGVMQRDIAFRSAYMTSYTGQQLPMNVLSPIKWAQFFESWKRGDFRKKK
jgi:hypothetical protein